MRISSTSIPILLTLSSLALAQLATIQSPCSSDSDCAEGCCAFGPNDAGKCSGPVIALETKGGCGFGDAQPNANAAIASGFSQQASSFLATAGGGSATPLTSAAAAGGAGAATATPAAGSSGTSSSSSGSGTVTIGLACTSDSDCQEGCCAFGPNDAGQCSGPVIALETKGGCGFGDAQPNANAAAASGFTQQASSFSASLGSATAAAGGSSSGSSSGSGADSGSGAGAGAAAPAPTTLATVLISAGPGTQPNTAGAGAAAPQATDSSGSSGSTGSSASTGSSSCKGTIGTGNAAPGNGAGGAFITACCESDADCASTCCDFVTGICAAADVAKGNGHGCNFGGSSPVFKNSVKRRYRTVPMKQ